MVKIEDIEYLRTKAGISYEDAKELLEKNNGDVVKALCDLEQTGKLGNKNTNNKKEKTLFDQLVDLCKIGYENRLVVKRKEDIILNLSINFVIFTFVVALHISFIGFLLSIILGYKISFQKEGSNTNADAEQTVKDFVDKAGVNLKKTVNEFVKDNDNETEIKVKETEDGFNEATIEK